MDEHALTAAANAGFAVPSIYFAAVLLARGHRAVTSWGRALAYGVALMLFGIGLRIGMWALAIVYRPDAVHYHPYIFEIRDHVTLLSWLVFLLGLLSAHVAVNRGMARKSCEWCGWVPAVGVALGAVGITYWAAM